MKKILFLLAFVLTAVQIQAGNVDPASARQTASRFVSKMSTAPGRRMAPAANSDLRLVYTEVNSSNVSLPVFYIFNTADNYIIVSGDDRANEILAYGDAPLDVNNIPDAMRLWLNGYKEQLEYLQANPGMVVETSANRAPSRRIESVEPLLTALWDQGHPYNLQCPSRGYERCLTGCPATSLSMVFYYWKYPTEPTPVIPGYTTQSLGMHLPELPSITFDWDNMIDRYHSGYNGTQANAMAWLMRYIGQAEQMDYTPQASGSYGENILYAVNLFGYDENARLVYKTRWNGQVNYTDEEWGALMQEELEAYRPMVMCAYTSSWEGHAFNVDGYDSDNDLYHINWGWSGSGNAFCAMNAFSGGGMTFNVSQQLILGIEPPPTEPTIRVWSSKVNINCFAEKSATATFTVKGALLTNDVSLTLNDENGVFAISTDNVSLNEVNNGVRVTVTYSPETPGNHTASVTLKSEGAADATVLLNGTATLETYEPTMLDASEVTASSFCLNWNDNTPAHNVTSYRVECTDAPYNELKLAESFNKSEYSGTSTSDCSSKLDDIAQASGWTGSKVYRNDNMLILGNSKSKGWLETPPMDMRGNNNLVTVKVSAKASGVTTNAAPLKIICGEADTTLIVNNDETVYCVMLPCAAGKDKTVRLSSVTGSRVAIGGVEVYAGDDFSPIDLSTAVYHDGINGTSFKMENVNPGIYKLRVQGVYTDGTSSTWSNCTRVSIDWPRGDLNHDGEINIADINTLINLIFNQETGWLLPPATYDLTGDGEINIADINAVINIVNR